MRTLGLPQRNLLSLQPDRLRRHAQPCRTDLGTERERELVQSAISRGFGCVCTREGRVETVRWKEGEGGL